MGAGKTSYLFSRRFMTLSEQYLLHISHFLNLQPNTVLTRYYYNFIFFKKERPKLRTILHPKMNVQVFFNED